MDRRAFLQRVGVAGGLSALAGLGFWLDDELGGPARSSHLARRARPSGRVVQNEVTLANGMSLPTAPWVSAENARAGTLNWLVAGHQVPHGIEGYADRTSTVMGETVTLFVSTTAPTFHVEAYRMGWYQGTGGRLIWASPEVPGSRQAPSALVSPTNTVECHWTPSISFPIQSSWPPGVYLLKLVGSGGEQQFVPLTLRDDSSTAAYVIQNSVTTWQAYNLWGNYSLYYGPEGSSKIYATRSRVVSFDRPYPLDWANGAADLLGNELPLIMLAERMGLDVTYWTDFDLDQRANLLVNHRALLSLGHDEYWSVAMRNGATAARDSGVNLVFFGANACFRRIRFEASPVGAGRRQICYKSASEDPLYGVDDVNVTANWPDPPAANPQNSLIGSLYQSNPVNADLAVGDPSAWIYSGTAAAAGDAVAGVVGSEYDAYEPGQSSPQNVQIMAHSPLVCRGERGYSDITWYTAPSGGGVLATGTNWWISKLVNAPLLPAGLLPGPFPGVTGDITQMTQNVLSVVGWGPAGHKYPSSPNWQLYYAPNRAQSAGSAGEHAA